VAKAHQTKRSFNDDPGVRLRFAAPFQGVHRSQTPTTPSASPSPDEGEKSLARAVQGLFARDKKDCCSWPFPAAHPARRATHVRGRADRSGWPAAPCPIAKGPEIDKLISQVVRPAAKTNR